MEIGHASPTGGRTLSPLSDRHHYLSLIVHHLLSCLHHLRAMSSEVAAAWTPRRTLVVNVRHLLLLLLLLF